MAFRRTSHVAWRRIGDETVLIHLKSKRIYVLNSCGGYLWHALNGDRSLPQILETLPVEEDRRDEASGRLEQFVGQLSDAGLVVEGPEDGSKEGSADEAHEVKYTLSHFVPPELVWQEEIRNFGVSCAFIGGKNAACNAIPTM